MSYIKEFIQKIETQKAPAPNREIDDVISIKIIELAERVSKWHEKIPIPERWQPIQLGRIAARFSTSRELMAATLQYAGFQETKTSNMSLWTRTKFNKE